MSEVLSNHELALHVIHVVEDVDNGVLTWEDMVHLARLHPDATVTLAKAYEALRSEIEASNLLAGELSTLVTHTALERNEWQHQAEAAEKRIEEVEKAL